MMKVAVVGAGLIGGSVGLSIKRHTPGTDVAVFDNDPEAGSEAVRRGAADRAAPSLEVAVADVDLVVIATPVSGIPELVRRALEASPEGTIVTDVGSAKVQVALQVEQLGDRGSRFVGGHPMAGSEEAGMAAARPDLFDGAWWILTPTDATAEAAFGAVRDFVTTLGARPIALTPAEHDSVMAVISHLPQLLATTLMNVAAGWREGSGALALAAGGFRDVTRVAASSPEIWADICRENRDAIVGALEVFSERLQALRDLIEVGDEQALRSELERARDARRGLPSKAFSGDPYEVRVEIPDRPGVLAEVTTTIGALGINIEDLGIVHSPEGGRGTVRLAVSGEDASATVVRALRDKGYTAKAMGL